MGPLHSIGLIAGREFRVYVATASFWVALALGPLVLIGAMAFAQLSAAHAAGSPVMVTSNDARLGKAAEEAVRAAATVDRRSIAIAESARDALIIRRMPDGGVMLTFSPQFPLSPAARALVASKLELADMARVAGGARPKAYSVEATTAPDAAKAAAGVTMSRLALVIILWTTLTGSLGMLLQAVTRERTNRALESLLASARPWEVAVGKVLGVGGVSLLVLVSWLAASAAMALFAPAGDGLLRAVIGQLGDPALLARAVVIYVLAFAFYGLVTVALGARARDSAAAQNLARPMFILLVAVFFVSLTIVGGAQGFGWLVYVPPFTPFMLLLLQSASATSELIAVLGLALATAAAGYLAARGLKIER